MKKRLNNLFKKKVLVSCNERELSFHEILLKEDSEGKIIAKERNSDGKIKDITGGSSGGGSTPTEVSRNIIAYYSVSTTGDATSPGTKGYPQIIEVKAFDDILDLLDRSRYPESTQNGTDAVFCVSNYSDDVENCSITVEQPQIGTLNIVISIQEQKGPIQAFYYSPIEGGFFTVGRVHHQNLKVLTEETGVKASYGGNLSVVSYNNQIGGLYDVAQNIMFLYSAPSEINITLPSEDVGRTYIDSFQIYIPTGENIKSLTVNGESFKGKEKYLQ